MRKNLRSLRTRALGHAFARWLSVGAATVLGGAGCLHGTAPALAVEATPAEFSLPSTGGMLDSRAAVAQGPLVLIFYRGHW